MIKRREYLSRVGELLASNPVVGIIGARQVGKTTLARQYLQGWSGPVHFFDLEDPRDEAKLADPMIAFEELQGLIVLDEVQHTPEIFKALRVLCDRDPLPAKFLVLGSASPELLRQSAESLAGRISYLELRGLGLNEVGSGAMNKLWIRGGFPRSFLAETDEESARWRRDFIKTFLERDLPGLGVRMPASSMRRFWTMMAHYHGQLWNASEIGRSFGVADTTVRRYLDTLEAAFVVRVLQPWHENIGKRQVKAPKTYVADSGIAHALLGLWDESQILGHPKMGATWEGFALKTVVEKLDALPEMCFFWRTHTGAELDLLVIKDGRRLGFEFKRTDSPQVTRSMQNAAEDLRLDRLFVIHAGKDSFSIKKGMHAIPLSRVWDAPELSQY